MVLAPGARIGVFAPSHHFDPLRLERGVAVLEAWGYDVVRGPHLGARHRWFAGTDVQRLAALQWALSEPGLDAAWMARGGSGLTRILGGVDWAAARARPIVGFSDGTALHVALRQRAGISGLHGPVITSLGDSTDEGSRAWLRALLASGVGGTLSGRTVVEGAASGPLVGGNLAVLAALCGTPDQLDARGAVLLLEEVGEFGYRIDRMLQQLAAAGCFEGVVGVALGSFVSCPVPDEATLLAVLLESFGELGVPVVADLPVGHGPENRAFYYGRPCRLRADSDGASLSLGSAPGVG